MSEIVFVHLGDAPAKHLWLNIAKIRSEFPSVEITVVFSSQRHLKKIQKLDVKPFFYTCKPADEDLLNGLSHDSSFRNGFWRYSLERLLALAALHEERFSNISILHLESDILLLPGFPFESLQMLPKLAWCKFNETHDVSAILYSPNSAETNWLANTIRKELKINADLTDMTVLSVLGQKYPTKVNYLPSLHSPESNYFEGVFDGAAIGMWLTGRDPRNKFGLIQRHLPLPEGLDNPSLYKFKSSSNIHLEANRENEKKQIYNLHIHSKSPKLFKRFSRYHLTLEVFRTFGFIPSTSFSILTFIKIVKSHLERHKWKSIKVLIGHVRIKLNSHAS